MTVKTRILALRLLNRLEEHPACAERIGVRVVLRKKDPKDREDRNA